MSVDNVQRYTNNNYYEKSRANFAVSLFDEQYLTFGLITYKHLKFMVLSEWSFSTDQFRNLEGHKFQVITSRYFPYMDYTPDSDQPGSTVMLRDSVDARMIQIFAATLNFT